MKFVIIGNGVAGVTCARYLRKYSDHHITIVGSESEHFFSRPALMYIYMGHMTYQHTKPYENDFWQKNRINLVNDYALRIDTRKRQVVLANSVPISYDVIVLATGSKPAFFNWPGQDLIGVQGFTTLQDVARLEVNTANTRSAVIVGGGLIGVEVAEMLCSRRISVSMLVRESTYWSKVLPKEESYMIGNHIAAHHVDVHYETELKQIVSDENGCVSGVITSKGDNIPCQTVVIAAGVKPNVELASQSGLNLVKGVLIDDAFATSNSEIYAIGDCAQFPDGRVDQLWYTARLHGRQLAEILTGQRIVYEPEPFFNSAKFFDIEYQTYGHVPGDLTEVDSFVWQSVKQNRLLRITHLSGRVVGFNALGIRLRSKTCLQWIADGAELHQVLEELKLADFDQEFSGNIQKIFEERGVL